jgi:serine/threonine protein kinase
MQIASALQYLHAQGVVHGDLSAWNVMLTSIVKDTDARNFVAKLVDFGLSRALDSVQVCMVCVCVCV